MLRFLTGKPGLGIEITSSAARFAAVSRRGGASVLFTKTVELPAGAVNEQYASPNILDVAALSAAVRSCLDGAASRIRRAALSLPDGVFRVQTFDFDELPVNVSDREKLIRWRIEKSAAFDTSDTVLRYQVLGRQGKGLTVLACVIKRVVLSQYEEALQSFGLEPWSVGLSSFHALNFYSSFINGKSAVAGLAHLTKDSFATIVADKGGARFYRYKELKRGGADGIRERLVREIEDSLHFYTHMDRAQQAEVKTLYLTGEAADMAAGFASAPSLDVEALSPGQVLSSAAAAGSELAAALGAGCSL